jgi:hypothetical protein
MTDTAGPCVGACIDALPGWQQAFCREVRQLVHAAGSQVTETVMRTNRPCFVLEGYVPLRRGIVPGREGIIIGGPASKTGRTVAIRYGEAVTAPALIALFWQIIANDGGGRLARAWSMSKPAVPRHSVAAHAGRNGLARREDRQLRGARVVAGSGHGGLERHALRSG